MEKELLERARLEIAQSIYDKVLSVDLDGLKLLLEKEFFIVSEKFCSDEIKEDVLQKMLGRF